MKLRNILALISGTFLLVGYSPAQASEKWVSCKWQYSKVENIYVINNDTRVFSYDLDSTLLSEVKTEKYGDGSTREVIVSPTVISISSVKSFGSTVILINRYSGKYTTTISDESGITVSEGVCSPIEARSVGSAERKF